MRWRMRMGMEKKNEDKVGNEDKMENKNGMANKDEMGNEDGIEKCVQELEIWL